MGKMQREKGKTFERQIASVLRAAFPRATVRRASQAVRAYEPDVVIEGDAPAIVRSLWLELTDSRAPEPADKLRQAEGDVDRVVAAGLPARLPIVVWHRLGERRIWATARLRTLVTIAGGDAPVRMADAIATVLLDDLVLALLEAGL